MLNSHATYNEPFIPDGAWEVAIKSYSIIIRIISLVRDDMLQKSCLMPQNFRKSAAERTLDGRMRST